MDNYKGDPLSGWVTSIGVALFILIGFWIVSSLFHSSSNQPPKPDLSQEIQDLQTQLQITQTELNQVKSDLDKIKSCNYMGGSWKYGYCNY